MEESSLEIICSLKRIRMASERVLLLHQDLNQDSNLSKISSLGSSLNQTSNLDSRISHNLVHSTSLLNLCRMEFRVKLMLVLNKTRTKRDLHKVVMTSTISSMETLILSHRDLLLQHLDLNQLNNHRVNLVNNSLSKDLDLSLDSSQNSNQDHSQVHSQALSLELNLDRSLEIRMVLSQTVLLIKSLDHNNLLLNLDHRMDLNLALRTDLDLDHNQDLKVVSKMDHSLDS